MKPETEEQIIARYTDRMYNGWQGLDHYWKHFEPEFYVFASKHLNHYFVYKESKIPNPEKVCFRHFHADMEVRHALNAYRKGNKEDWMK